MPRLCISLDHVATLREARKGPEPDLVSAAVLVRLAGAEALAVHLRTDRRHVQDRDVQLLRATVRLPLRLRLANSSTLVHEATSFKPALVTLLPERRDEVTTEGGIDVLLDQASLHRQVKALHESGLRVGLFVEPELDQVRAAAKIEADVVEIDAYHYATAQGEDAAARELERIATVTRLGAKIGLEMHAGHGLSYETIRAVGSLGGISEVRVGHAVIARAMLVGMRDAVGELRARLNGG